MYSLDNKHILPKGIFKKIYELLKKSVIYEMKYFKAHVELIALIKLSIQVNEITKKPPFVPSFFPFCKKITQPARMQMFVAVQCYYLSA